MKKITLIFFLTLISFCSYGQLALEGFEDTWSPADGGTATTGWFQFQNSVGLIEKWAQGPAGNSLLPPYDGLRAAYLQRENVAPGILPEDYLVTPQFNVPLEPELRFYSRLTIAGDQGSIYKVFIVDLTTNPTANLNVASSYTELESWTELEINPVQTEYAEIVVPLPAEYIGKNVRIAFMMTGDNFDRWLVDNVKVVKKCLAPETLDVLSTTLTSAELTWANPSGSTQWEIEVVTDAGIPTGTGVAYSGTLPYHATTTALGEPLVEGGCYKFYVRSVCDGGGVSGWAGAFYFCTKVTGSNCSFPIVINSLPFSDLDDTASFGDDYNGNAGTGCGTSNWEDYLSGNDVVYQYTATFTGAINIDLSENGQYSGIFVYNNCASIGVSCLDGGTGGYEGNPVSLDDFPVVAGEDYYFVISTSSQPTTPYQLIIQAVACDEPTNLSVGTTGLTTALLSWDNPSGATSWEVVVQPSGSSIPSGSGTTVTDNSDYLWPNLTASTAYQYWVRADCGNGSFSAWAGPYQFHTQVCDAIFQCEFTFTMWDLFSWDTWNGDKILVKQNGLTIATLTGPAGDGNNSVVTVPVCNNLPVQLVWQGGGSSWAASEIGLSVKNSFNQTIFTKNPDTAINNPQLYEVVVDCDQPYCLPPEDLTATNATLTTVDLGWAGDATGNWDYYIVPAGSPAPTDATPGTPTTTNPTIGAGPLVASTDYEYYVRMHCTNSSTPVSGWAGPYAFSSSVCDPVEKCSYNFILNAPWDGWDDVVLTVRQNGTNVAVLGSDFTSGDGNTMTVPVALCNGVPFEVIMTNDGNWAGQVGLEIVNNFDQSIFFRDLYEDGSSGMVLFTDAVDCLHPKCLPPTGLASANGTMTSIDLSWDGPAIGSWEYVVLPAGSPAPTAATPGTPTTANPTVAVPLDAPATNYDFYVRLVCTDATDPASIWAGPLAIHSEVCDPADKCVFHFELLSDGGYGFGSQTMTVYQAGVPVAVLGPGFDWNAPSQDSMMVDVPLCPNEEIQIVWDNTGSWDDYDKGLHVYSPYMEDIYIKPFGEGAQGDTLYTGMISCDPPACLKPLNLSVSDVALNSVTLEWDEMGSATSWEVWVLPYGSPAPTEPGTVVTENPVSWPNLTPGTPYQFYVRANCEGDGYSTWTGPFAFVTAIVNDECAGAINVPVNTGAVCSTVVAGTMSGSTSSGLTPSCYWQEPENDVWYSFTATGPNHVVTVQNLVGVEVGYALYEGGCEGLAEVSCTEYSYQDGAAIGVLSGLTAGETYYVQVYASYFPEPTEPTSFDICVTSPASIVVDTTMAVEDVVMTSLVVESCATFENITWSTGSDFGSANGIGRFEKGLSTFGIEEGVVLMTGRASQAPGPNVGDKLGGYPDDQWPGDTQLFDYMTDLGIDVGTYNDATLLEFDFTPLANKLRFPFIFASEEYGQYQCSFSDAFAFFLTPLDENGDPAGPTTNLAVVPGTNAPVSVVTIRDGAFNDGCDSVNPNYFDNYYGTDFGADLSQAIDPMFAPINFQGMTVRMNAESDVVAGQKYHIKLVIADRGDSGMDSAVFIGAFDIGKPDLGVDLTIENGNGVCNGDSYTIVSDLDATDYTFTWYEKPIGAPDTNYTVIEGETSNELTVTANGEYKLVASFGGLCEANDTVVIEFYPDVEEGTGNPTQLVVCDADGFATFNLSDNTANILAGPNGPLNPDDYTISYHLTAEDAEGDLNPLPLTDYENEVQGLQEIYVRIVTKDGCVGIKSFSLIVEDRTPNFTVNNDFTICAGTAGTITVTPAEPANYDPATVTYVWTKDGFAYPGTTASIVVTEAGLYEVTIDNQGCPGVDSVIVSVTPSPVADDPADVDVCGKYVLPELSANNNYYTGPGGTGTMLSANDEITSTQTIYVFAYSELTPSCTSENSFVVNVVPEVFVNIAEKCEGNNYILEAMFDDDSIYNADNVTFEWTNESGASLGNGATLTIVEQGKYFLTATPAGQEIACPKTVEVQVDSTTCDIPRGVSPNGDGYNDSFDLSTLDVEELKIFNRYGQEVYSKRNYTNEWMGQTSKGDELPTGTYFYMIKRSNGESKTGWVYINRQE
ncbi:choice-of-anchor L domain-containing protein [Flavobacterium suzhouense]|uniref:Choice-of-anchor L domain-containing protein n=1 Tax=Flavobacterium suzhouense TaxID=1529638 RepID=A0ABW5NND2_9FLAO